MPSLNRAQIEEAILWSADGESGEMELDIPALGIRLKLAVTLQENRGSITDSYIQSINDLQQLTVSDRDRIVDLLYDDAMQAREQADYCKTIQVERAKPSAWLERLFWTPRVERKIVSIPKDDPAHPCFMAEGKASVLGKITWLEVRVEDFWSTQHRFALIDCRPTWEDEHGRTIVIRDGHPYKVADYQVDPRKFDGV